MIQSNLPPDFSFSQKSLQDYRDCPRRFQLRYLEKLSWPASPSEPMERYEYLSSLGTQFHKLVHQYLSGLEPAHLQDGLTDSILQRWFDHFLDSRFVDIPEPHFPEISLVSRLNEFRLIAKYDLVYLENDGKFYILDWKTSHTKPPRGWLENRIQSMLYPYLLSAAGHTLFPVPDIHPDTIYMVYWYPSDPQKPEVFHHSAHKQSQYDETLRGLLSEIQDAADGLTDFPKTDVLDRCLYCRYRSFCDRGEKAGDLENHSNSLLFNHQDTDLDDLDFEQVIEIEY